MIIQEAAKSERMAMHTVMELETIVPIWDMLSNTVD